MYLNIWGNPRYSAYKMVAVKHMSENKVNPYEWFFFIIIAKIFSRFNSNTNYDCHLMNSSMSVLYNSKLLITPDKSDSYHMQVLLI